MSSLDRSDQDLRKSKKNVQQATYYIMQSGSQLSSSQNVWRDGKPPGRWPCSHFLARLISPLKYTRSSSYLSHVHWYRNEASACPHVLILLCASSFAVVLGHSIRSNSYLVHIPVACGAPGVPKNGGPYYYDTRKNMRVTCIIMCKHVTITSC